MSLLRILAIVALAFLAVQIFRAVGRAYLARQKGPARSSVEADLRPCPVCGTYVGWDAPSCGRAACPMGQG